MKEKAYENKIVYAAKTINMLPSENLDKKILKSLGISFETESAHTNTLAIKKKRMKAVLGIAACLAFFIIVLSLIIYMKTSAGKKVNAGLLDEHGLDSVEGEKMLEFQKDAMDANETLYNSFDWDETYVYPDDFAGTYIKYNSLYVLVTDAASIEKYNVVLNGYKCVKYEIVKHSYNELYKLVEEAFNELKDIYDITSYYVDIRRNIAVLTVTKEAGVYDDHNGTLEIRVEERQP